MSVLLYEKRGRIAFITLNRPERLNTLNASMLDALIEAWRDFKSDPELWVAVLTGTGERAFCAGLELREYQEHDLPTKLLTLWQETAQGTLDMRLSAWKPVIAAVNGAARAGGVSISLYGDVRIASTTATFGYPEVVNGIPPAVATILLPRVVGHSAATKLLLTGDAIDANEAHRIGLVHEVVAPDQLQARAVELAEKLTTSAPLAIWATKQQLIRGAETTLHEGLRLTRALGEEIHRTQDFEEGRQAFLERRKPVYRGV
ncbi:MAG: enoyl-CoA hydratase/isomerase family protein [Chloroflexi bacterium]|nr:enoyl-CoA hydratase/isomerase family protein [Chloroflexota bacterium]